MVLTLPAHGNFKIVARHKGLGSGPSFVLPLKARVGRTCEAFGVRGGLHMSDKLFKEGDHNIRRVSPNEYSMTLALDEDGRLARECPNNECSPGYFKVKVGTGITEGQESAFCPYCRMEANPGDFITKEQLRYAEDHISQVEDHISQEVQEEIENTVKSAVELGASGKIRVEGDLFPRRMSPKSIIRRPFEEEVRRDIICPYCGLKHSVYGLAIWCADCGHDVLLTHIEAEISVVSIMLGDMERRRAQLGARVAAKDLENCLEDTVSIFEAVLRVLVKRYLRDTGLSEDKLDNFFKKLRNGFQNVHRSIDIFSKEIGIPLFIESSADEIDELSYIFEKRHPITHNLGVVDNNTFAKKISWFC